MKKKLNILIIVVMLVLVINIVGVSFNAEPSVGESYSPEDYIVIEQPQEVDPSVVPVFTNAIDCYAYAEQVLYTSKGVESTVTGHIKSYKNIFPLGRTLIIHQDMNNARYTDNNGIKYSWSNSTKHEGMLIGKNNYQQVVFDTRSDTGKVYKRVTNELSNGSPNFTNKWDSFTRQEYTKSNGTLPGTLSYIVNKNTITNVNYFNKTSSGYSFKFTLDNSKSVVNYRHLVKNSVNADSYPMFTKIEIACEVDMNGKFKSIIMSEAYIIKLFGISAETECLYNEQFKCIGGDVANPFNFVLN